MYSDLRVSGSRGGEPKGKGGKKGEREEEKRKNQDLGWRKMAVPMQTTRRVVRLAAIGQVNDATYACGAREPRCTP